MSNSLERGRTFHDVLDRSLGRVAVNPDDVKQWTCVIEDEGESSPYACDAAVSGPNYLISSSRSFGAGSYFGNIWKKITGGD